MKPESLQYLLQFEEVFDVAHRSGYVRNIPIRKLKRLISIYEEIIGGKSGYNAHNMCRSGGSCLKAFILELRVEYVNQKNNPEPEDKETIKPVKKNNKDIKPKTEEDGSEGRQTEEV